MTEAQRTKAIARSKAKMALRRGKIVRQPCDGCGEPKSQMHHDDYAQPLLVRWLCATCHRAHHATMKHLIPRGTDNREGRINDA